MFFMYDIDLKNSSAGAYGQTVKPSHEMREWPM